MSETTTLQEGTTTSEEEDKTTIMDVAPTKEAPSQDDLAAEAAMNAGAAPRKARGIQVNLVNGKLEAIVPRNALIFLDAVTKNKALTLDEQKASLSEDQLARITNPAKVYKIGVEIPAVAFPGSDSAKTLVQSAKANLADEGTEDEPKQPVIRILKAGTHGQPAIIEVLVNSWKQKEGNQGIRMATTSTGAKRGPKAKSTTGAKRGPKPGSTRKVKTTAVGSATPAKRGRKPGSTNAKAAIPTPVRGGRKVVSGLRERFMNSLQLPSYGDYKNAEEGMDMLETKYPKLYSAFLKLKLAA